MVHFMLCELYLNKAIIKTNKHNSWWPIGGDRPGCPPMAPVAAEVTSASHPCSTQVWMGQQRKWFPRTHLSGTLDM